VTDRADVAAHPVDKHFTGEAVVPGQHSRDHSLCFSLWLPLTLAASRSGCLSLYTSHLLRVDQALTEY
jgi:hypothetical protein